jgi:hypothetical protein
MTKTPLDIRRLEISKEYRNTKVKDDELIKKTSRQILDVFDEEYYTLINNPSADYTDLRKFIMYFINGNFKKQIKMNIYVSMVLFRIESEFSNEIFNILRPRLYKNKEI